MATLGGDFSNLWLWNIHTDSKRGEIIGWQSKPIEGESNMLYGLRVIYLALMGLHSPWIIVFTVWGYSWIHLSLWKCKDLLSGQEYFLSTLPDCLFAPLPKKCLITVVHASVISKINYYNIHIRLPLKSVQNTSAGPKCGSQTNNMYQWYRWVQTAELVIHASLCLVLPSSRGSWQKAYLQNGTTGVVSIFDHNIL